MKPRVRAQDVWRLFLKHRAEVFWLEFAIIAAVGIGEALSLFAPIYYKKFFDTLYDAPAATPDVAQALIHSLLIIFVFHVGGWLVIRVATVLWNYTTPLVMRDLERTGFSSLLGHSTKFFANTFVGSLIRKLRRLSRSYEDVTEEIIWNLWPLFIFVTGSIVVMWSRSALISGAVLAWLVVLTVLNHYVFKYKSKFDEASAKADADVTGLASDAVTNILNVKIFGGQGYERRLFADRTDDLRRLQTLSWNIAEVNQTIQWGLIIMIEFFMLYYAVGLWQKGLLTVGDFALFQGYLTVLFWRSGDLGKMVRRLYEAVAQSKEMVEIIKMPQEIRDRRGADVLKVKNARIDFQDVVFAYTNKRKVLDQFNLSIRPKEKVAIVGSSGAGKSTIVKLLMRFHDLQKGRILIDGQNIARVTQESLRQQVALVPQESILFHRTLMENIRYGRRDATDEEVIQAAKEARCHDFITDMPDGYNTPVGERGIKLSGGERQRVAIARAILKDAPILVLDEATSSLDSESEHLIQEAFIELMENKTAVVIAHRLSTILKMDRVIVVDQGQVVESGSHQELLAKGGTYRKLWEIQSGGFLE
ncbi:ABC transporter ATP-binding protein [Candidatus Uhrbacteria bacterium]|nr:ABC transporter ATP-binding protein [Candidatus Uhrbacteria bacterium]